MGIGDWGLGIGPNPQSPIPKNYFKNFYFMIPTLLIINMSFLINKILILKIFKNYILKTIRRN
jgi:hypothetical protein